MKYKTTKEQLEEAVKNSLSIAEVCRLLDIRPCGGNYKTLQSKFKLYNIDNSHFTGKVWNQGSRYKPFGKITPIKDILVKNSNYMNTRSLKERLFREGLKSKKCEVCSITHWLGNPAPLELDHINGDNMDHRIENLRILCPNCHALTPTHRGKNLLSARSEKRDVEYRKFREALTDNADGNPEPSLSNKEGAETRHGTPKE